MFGKMLQYWANVSHHCSVPKWRYSAHASIECVPLSRGAWNKLNWKHQPRQQIWEYPLLNVNHVMLVHFLMRFPITFLLIKRIIMRGMIGKIYTLKWMFFWKSVCTFPDDQNNSERSQLLFSLASVRYPDRWNPNYYWSLPKLVDPWRTIWLQLLKRHNFEDLLQNALNAFGKAFLEPSLIFLRKHLRILRQIRKLFEACYII